MYIVTGCSSGLGYEIAKLLVKRKETVVGISRKVGKSKFLIKEHPNFSHLSIDLSLLGELEPLIEIIEKINDNSINLVLNAAKFHYEQPGQENLKICQEIFNTNYFGAINLIQNCKLERLNRVLFINSIAGLEAQESQAQYSSSKHSLQAYSEILAKQSVGMNFDVMSINPGGINTELWHNSNLINKDIVSNFIDPRDLAALICNILDMPKKTYIKSMTILPEHDV